MIIFCWPASWDVKWDFGCPGCRHGFKNLQQYKSDSWQRKSFSKRRKLAKWKLVSVHGCCSINKFEIWRMRRVSAFRISRFRTLNQVSASGLHSPLHHWYILLNKVALQNAFFEEVRNRQDAKQPVGLQSAFLLTKHTRRPYFRNYVQQSKRKKRANYQLSHTVVEGVLGIKLRVG